MKSVVVKTIDDFEKITDETELIEMVEYDDKFAFTKDCILPEITFTRMDVFLDKIPISIVRLGLYNSEFEGEYLNRFINLKKLDITNSEVDIEWFSMLDLRSLRLDYCSVENYEKLSSFEKLETISLYNTLINDFYFLFDIENLKEVRVDEEAYKNNQALFKELAKRNVLVTDMMGGIFDEV